MATTDDEIVIRVAAGEPDETPRIPIDQHMPPGRTTKITLAELQSLIGGAGTKSYAMVSMGTSQDFNFSAGDHVEYDQITEQSANADISVSTGAGQANGLITLPAGKVFKVEANIGVIFGSAASFLRIQIRDNTAGALVGEFANVEPLTVASDVASSETAHGYVPASSTEIEVRIVFASGTITQIQRSAIRSTSVRITEV